MIMLNLTFDEFCHNCHLYEPTISYEQQCTGYKILKKMVEQDITPASLEEIERWEKNPTIEELFDKPNIKYLRSIHILLRPFIIQEWNKIKKLKCVS